MKGIWSGKIRLILWGLYEIDIPLFDASTSLLWIDLDFKGALWRNKISFMCAKSTAFIPNDVNIRGSLKLMREYFLI